MKNCFLILIAVLTAMSATLSLSCKSEKSPQTDNIENQEWVLESRGEPDKLQAVLAGTEITLTFDSPEDEVRGSAGCNSYFGDYTINGNKLSIGQVGHTEMYCMDPQGIMEQEQEYLSALQSAKGFQLTDGKLNIECDNKVLIFIGRGDLPATVMPPLDDGVKSILLEVSCEEFMAAPHITREIDITFPGSLVVSLCTNPSTGFEWEEVKIGDESVIYQTERNHVSPEATGVVGGSGKDVWSFNSASGGTSTLIFEYSRPWEGGEKDEWTLALTVNVD
jgi:heat shock protein HslJ/predicted secreted protein